MRLRSAPAALLTAVALAAGATTAFAPSPANTDTADVPVFMTDNVEVVGAFPEPSLVAVTFDPDEPVMYATSLSGFTTWDISDPTLPVLLGKLPFPHFSNENVKLGVREDGTRFIMAGFDLVGYSPQAGATDTRGRNRFVVIDVTDPGAPSVAATVNTETRTHTMGCANSECTHAYTAGSGGAFDIYDMTDITQPKHVQTYENSLLLGNSTFDGGVGHDWDVDDAGVAWWVGSGGVVAFDVNDPENPVVLNSSDFRGQSTEFNKYISHNSQRPDAERFTSRDSEDVDEYSTGEDAPPGTGSVEPRENVNVDDIRDGEVLFVTEEDLSATGRCSSTRGGLQAWHVQELDAERYDAVNPELDRTTGGTISPIGKWTTEAGEVDDPFTTAGFAAFCSAHYFDVHHTGIVAQAWYMQGLRLIDGRDPTDLTQIGYFVTGAQEIFGAKWVPEYDDGGQTGLDTNLLYTEDPSRGIEILRVDLPEDGETVDAVRAPILPEWYERAAVLAATAYSPDFGYACRLG